MTRDTIVEEVRAARDAIAKEHDYDIAAIFVALREMGRDSNVEHVTLPPRRPRHAGSEAAVQQPVAPDGRAPSPSARLPARGRTG